MQLSFGKAGLCGPFSGFSSGTRKDSITTCLKYYLRKISGDVDGDDDGDDDEDDDDATMTTTFQTFQILVCVEAIDLIRKSPKSELSSQFVGRLKVRTILGNFEAVR